MALNRFALFVSFLALLVPVSFADKGGKSVKGVITLSFGRVRQMDGTYRSVRGLQVPFTAEPMHPAASGKDPHPAPSGDVATAYRNDGGAGSYFYSGDDFPMPSALDDIGLSSAGVGLPWSQLTVGYHFTLRQTVLLRWTVFDTFVSGRGAGVSAFDNVIADFGGLLTIDTTRFPQVPGSYKLTINIGVVGVTCPDAEIYFASQIREPDPPQYQGEGPFRLDAWVIFSGGGPSIGTSEDIFFYDYDPEPNGIYDETEADYFGGPPNQANLLLQIDTSGTSQELMPFASTVLVGTHTGGNFADMWFSDDTWFSAEIDQSAESTNPIEVLIETQSPTTNIVSLRFILEAHCTMDGFEQIVSLYNFTQNRFVEVSRGQVGIADGVIDVTLGGNPQQYVRSSDRRMWALVQYRELSAEIANIWGIGIDRATWTIVRP